MKNTILFLTIFLLSTVGLLAQPHFNNEQGNLTYRNNEMLINPAFAGSVANTSIFTIGARKQWVGFDKSPSSQTIQFHSPFANDQMGLGAWLFNENYGVNQNTQVNLVYAYKLKMKTGTLSLGLTGGVLTTSEDVITNLNDPNDPAFTKTSPRSWGFNAGFGAHYTTDKYFVGVSIPQFLSNEREITDGETKLKNEFDFDMMQFYLTGGYIFNVSPKIRLVPTALVQLASETSVGYEFMVKADYDKRFCLGVGYAAQNCFKAGAGVFINKYLSINYMYEQNVGSLYKEVSGSHSIVLNIYLGKKGVTPQCSPF